LQLQSLCRYYLPFGGAQRFLPRFAVTLCFQGRSQLEAIYGHQAEAMFSQPATKNFLKTSEPRAARLISDTLGEVEIERLRESRTQGQMPQRHESRSYQLEHEFRPLIMKEEITGLPKGHGFLKCGNLVVRLSFPYLELPQRHPAFLERKTEFDGAENSQAQANRRRPRAAVVPRSLQHPQPNQRRLEVSQSNQKTQSS
jgi:hypothetical protein